MTDGDKRAGGLWHTPVPLLNHEQVAQAEFAAYLCMGRLYLTNLRLIWSPIRLLSWYEPPRLIPLSAIERCDVGNNDLFVGYPVEVHTREHVYGFYVYDPQILWMRATRRQAIGWKEAIEHLQQPSSGRIAGERLQ